MRICWEEDDLQNQYETARNEAERAFGVPDVYLEKYLERPRHIEVQVFGDTHGRIVHLGERECSIQRRHQKLIEESPSPALTEETRRQMGDAAVRLCQAVNYVNAGTIEFLFQDGEFYFMEMNTRIQVEHPVTEEVTGIDLVKEQIRVAAGEPLSVPQGEFRLRGHAMEFRVNAEDPVTFAPNPGKIRELHLPGGPGVRVDTHIYRDYQVPPHYDSLLAKLVVRGKDRMETISRARRALEQFVVEGVKTSIPLHRAILNNEQFIRGDISTRFMDKFTL
jgi:acetyl-CoA carboxylase biotin carboxylase subunit